MRRRIILLVIGFVFTFHVAKAQFNDCIDSNRVNPWEICTMEFMPVCGCNNVTYDNSCESYWRGGVNTIAYSGVCQQDLFAFAFTPNPVVTHMNFKMQLASNLESDGSMTISDIFGNIVYFRLLHNLNGEFPYLETIPLYGLETGMYFVLVKVGNVSKVKKFVKFRI